MDEFTPEIIALSTLCGVFGGLIAFGAAHALREILARPRLSIDFERAKHARVSGPIARPGALNGAYAPQAVVIRVRVANQGRSVARDVTCLVREVIRADLDRARHFDDETVDLRWSHRETRVRDLAPGEARYVDVCYTQEDDALSGVRLASDHVPARLAGMLASPGRFHFHLSASAQNAAARRRSISVDWEGRWYDLVPWSPRRRVFDHWRRTPWSREAVATAANVHDQTEVVQA